jgi:hypothetical protein
VHGTESLILSAASTAFSQKPLTTGGIPSGGIIDKLAWLILKDAEGASGSITCFAQTTIFSPITITFITNNLYL